MREDTWDRAAERVVAEPYLDPLVADAKRRAHLALLDRWLPPLDGTSVLKTDLWEEAVGGDELLFTLARRAREATGIDVSGRIVELARGSAATNGAGVTLTQADVLRLPFGDGAFDVVYLVAVLGEIAGRDAFLREAHRVLRPGGTLSVSEHVPDPDRISADEVARLASAAGFVFRERFGRPWSYTASFTRP